ncbi:MAG: hypothetical protein SFU27_00660 [Thermonemataceae bacterium]|nr:hypothetical protein [Thermonemataceae bacterium]
MKVLFFKINFLKVALFAAFALLSVLSSCKKEEEPKPTVNTTSIAPASSNGRDNINLGCVSISNRNVTISVWDNGAIDGDIVSVYVNGKLVIDEVEMDGPSNKYSVDVALDYEGFNYVLLYAHNEGTYSPNTASLSIDDGVSPRTFELSSDLNTNGYVDLLVNGSQHNLTCSNGGGGNNNGGGGNNNSTIGSATFWTQTDLGCGSITVSCGGTTQTITSYYSSGNPGCSASGCANFSLAPGTYNYSASCSSYTWDGTITVTAGNCSTMRLY